MVLLNLLIWYPTGNSFVGKINVSAVGCNPIIQNIIFEHFIKMVGIVLVVFVLFAILFSSKVNDMKIFLND